MWVPGQEPRLWFPRLTQWQITDGTSPLSSLSSRTTSTTGSSYATVRNRRPEDSPQGCHRRLNESDPEDIFFKQPPLPNQKIGGGADINIRWSMTACPRHAPSVGGSSLPVCQNGTCLVSCLVGNWQMREGGVAEGGSRLSALSAMSYHRSPKLVYFQILLHLYATLLKSGTYSRSSSL